MQIELNQFKRNVHSQGGEDGIIEKILIEAGVSGLEDGQFFVEFGAWDGVYLSNTCALVERGWRGVFIEANAEKFGELQRNYEGKDIDLVNQFVAVTGRNSLENILHRDTRFGQLSPEVLSIDIDSDDLRIWQSLMSIRPFIVVIEFNPTIPGDVSFVNPEGQQYGNSALAIYRHAKENNYELAAVTSSNLIFVCARRLPKTIKPLNLLDSLCQSGTRFFFGYDGTLIRSVNGKTKIDEVIPVPWADVPLPQPVPAVLRSRHRSSVHYKRFLVILGGVSLFVRRPLAFMGVLLKKSSELKAYLKNSLFSKSSGDA